MNDIGKDAKEVRAKYQLICPVCGKPAVRRENCPAGPAYLHLTKHGTLRHFVEAPSQALRASSPRRGAKKKKGA